MKICNKTFRRLVIVPTGSDNNTVIVKILSNVIEAFFSLIWIRWVERHRSFCSITSSFRDTCNLICFLSKVSKGRGVGVDLVGVLHHTLKSHIFNRSRATSSLTCQEWATSPQSPHFRHVRIDVVRKKIEIRLCIVWKTPTMTPKESRKKNITDDSVGLTASQLD